MNLLLLLLGYLALQSSSTIEPIQPDDFSEYYEFWYTKAPYRNALYMIKSEVNKTISDVIFLVDGPSTEHALKVYPIRNRTYMLEIGKEDNRKNFFSLLYGRKGGRISDDSKNIDHCFVYGDYLVVNSKQCLNLDELEREPFENNLIDLNTLPYGVMDTETLEKIDRECFNDKYCVADSEGKVHVVNEEAVFLEFDLLLYVECRLHTVASEAEPATCSYFIRDLQTNKIFSIRNDMKTFAEHFPLSINYVQVQNRNTLFPIFHSDDLFFRRHRSQTTGTSTPTSSTTLTATTPITREMINVTSSTEISSAESTTLLVAPSATLKPINVSINSLEAKEKSDWTKSRVDRECKCAENGVRSSSQLST
ncbi:hypothetical protein M3Y96_00746100 [Aphelenchoides besseyi]|nr:hypothetical protein M3Y96_00746100 [Aphelenchoides besseyi]